MFCCIATKVEFRHLSDFKKNTSRSDYCYLMIFYCLLDTKYITVTDQENKTQNNMFVAEKSFSFTRFQQKSLHWSAFVSIFLFDFVFTFLKGNTKLGHCIHSEWISHLYSRSRTWSLVGGK